MLLVWDIGNSNSVLGLFEGERLRAHWRLITADHTADELRVLISNLLQLDGIPLNAIEGCCMSSVVPPLNHTVTEVCETAFGIKPLSIGPGMKTGLVIAVENPKEVGADRIVNSVGAIEAYGAPLIVVDFGTATTFDAISSKNEFLGGIICPGIGISLDALFTRCAKLPRVDLVKPPRVIGRNTVSNITSGAVYGYADMVDGLIRRMRSEMGENPKVIVTGGYAQLIGEVATEVDHVDPFLTLSGLRLLYERNAGVTA
jgi:type III pantothenate kinase